MTGNAGDGSTAVRRVFSSHGLTVFPDESCMWKNVVPMNRPNTNTTVAKPNKVSSLNPMPPLVGWVFNA